MKRHQFQVFSGNRSRDRLATCFLWFIATAFSVVAPHIWGFPAAIGSVPLLVLAQAIEARVRSNAFNALKQNCDRLEQDIKAELELRFGSSSE